MEPIVFQPKGGIPPFLVLIGIMVGIGAFGVLRAMRSSGRSSIWILGGIVLVGVAAGAVVIQANRRAGAITVGPENIEGKGWSISYGEIRGVREDVVSSTQYSGGRPVVTTQRRLIVDTEGGERAVAHEGTYHVDSMRSALDAALTRYRARQ